MAEFSREEKLEAIEGICKYDRKLAEAITALADEIEEGTTDTHSDVFGQVVQGVNWTVEVLQQVMDVLDEKEKKLDKELINDALTTFDGAYKKNDDVGVVAAMKYKLAPAVLQICEVGEQFF